MSRLIWLLVLGWVLWTIVGCSTAKPTPPSPTPTPSTPRERVEGYESAVNRALWWTKQAVDDLERAGDDEVAAYMAGLRIGVSILSLLDIQPPNAEDAAQVGTGIDYVAEHRWIVGALAPCNDVGIIAFDLEGTTFSQLKESFALCNERLQTVESQMPVFFECPKSQGYCTIVVPDE